MRSCDVAVLLLTSVCLQFFESQMVVALPFRTPQQLSDDLEEYVDSSYAETSNSRSPRQSWPYYTSRGKKSEGMSANELLNQLYNIVRSRGEPNGKIKSVRFGISKR